MTSGILGLLVGSGSDEWGLSGVSGRIRRIAPDRGPRIGDPGWETAGAPGWVGEDKVRDQSLITGKGGYKTVGNASQVLPLQKSLGGGGGGVGGSHAKAGGGGTECRGIVLA